MKDDEPRRIAQRVHDVLSAHEPDLVLTTEKQSNPEVWLIHASMQSKHRRVVHATIGYFDNVSTAGRQTMEGSAEGGEERAQWLCSTILSMLRDG